MTTTKTVSMPDVDALIARAAEKHSPSRILPPRGLPWVDCIVDGAFWYNTEDGSTHIIRIDTVTQN
jgi:hypothetical protein